MTNTRHNTISQKALAILLALVMCLSVLAMGVSDMLFVRSFAAVTALTTFSASAGDTLSAGRYIVKTSKTLTGDGTNGLKIKAGATVLLYIPEGVTLTVTGANGGNATAGGSPANATATANNEGSNSPAGTAGAGGGGGYAGILVPSNSTLIITGKGTLKATGGKGGNAGAGGKGANAACVSATSVRDARTGGGGGGGGGAGGGGAGIGTNGGSGGAGGTGGAGFMKEGSNYVGIVNADGDTTGNPGGDGSVGGDAVACGTIYKLGNVTVTATAGAGGSASTSGGGAGSRDNTGKDTPRLCASGGAGGGAGGAGKAGANVGTGGGGGGGAGGGGGGGYWYSSKKAYGWRYANKGTGGSSGGANGTDASGDNDQGNWSTGGSGKGQGANASSKSYASGTPSYAQIDVTLDRKGGTTGDTSVKCTIGLDMASATMPTRAGYTFDGYFTEASNGTKYYDDEGASAHVWDGSAGTLYAHWTLIDYTATFKADDIPDPQGALNDSPNDNSADYTIESTFTFPAAPSKNYYTSDGTWKVVTNTGESNWTLGDTFAAGSTTSVGKYGNVIFRAQYTPIDYLVTFDPNGGAAVTSNYDVTTDTNHYYYNYECRQRPHYTVKTTLPATTWLGYTLVGWQPTQNSGNWDASVTYPAGTALAGKHGNVTLKAVWSSVTSTVTLNLGAGETISGSTSLSYAFASSLAVPNPSKTGYTFMGWKVTQIPNYGSDYTTYPEANRWEQDHEFLAQVVDNQIQPVTLDSGYLGDVTLAPIWEANEYTVTFHVGGEEPVPATVDPASKTFTIEDTFNLSTPSRVAYDFTNWSVNQHAEEYNWTAATYNGGQSVSGMYGSATLTANWTPKTYTATLNVNGGDALASSTRTFDYEHSADLPTPTRAGWSFDYWEVVSYDTVSSWQNDSENAATTFTGSLPVGYYGNVTLKAHWTHKDYTITKTNLSGSNDSVSYHIDDDAFTLGAPTQIGYTFDKWVVTSVGTEGNWTMGAEYGANESISGKYGNVTVKAFWNTVTYDITYLDTAGNQIGTVQNYTIEDAVTLPTYSEDGYTFVGWKVVSAGGNWIPDDEIGADELTFDTGRWNGDVTLELMRTPIGYQITYDGNGGSPIAALNYNIESTDTLPTPTRNGYDFDCWKVKTAAGNWVDSATFAAGDAVTGQWGSVTLQAQWTAKKYNITYYTGTYPEGIIKQGTFNETAPDLTAEEKAKPADAQYTYTFDHWEPGLTTVTGEASYTAVYSSTVNKYTVTWMIPTDVNGVPGNYSGTISAPIEYGQTPVYNGGVNPTMESADPDQYSWRFNGWSLTPGGTVMEGLPAVSGNATYYANFTSVLTPEKVHWIVNGTDNVELWGVGETPRWEHDTPTKPDANGYKYTFTHWDPTPVPVVDGTTYTYTAQFSESLQDYTITLKLNGGETSDPLTIAYQMGDSVTFPAPTRTAYTFAGWQLDAAVGTWSAGTLISPEDLAAYSTAGLWGNASFTAQWTPTEYTIRFAADSEFDVLPADMSYTIESTGAIPAATREGYTQTGWIVSVGAGNWTQGATLPAACTLLQNYGDITLTPVWEVNRYVITWISGDHEETSEVDYGSAIMAHTPVSRQGYTADWDEEVPATMPAHDLTFNAVYTAVDYYIRFNVNGGNALDNFYYTIEGCSVNQTPTFDTLPTPTREGATFTGWKVTAAQGNWVRNAIVSGGSSLNGKYGNVTLTAQWDLERHTITWAAGDETRETVWFYGSMPSFDGTPYKSPDESHSYTFTGWDKEIVPVTEDVTYTALFDPTDRMYTVIWNVDGATRTEYYTYGATPVYPGESDPVRLSTQEYDFTFSGWSPAVAEVTGDVTYTAQFDVFTKLQSLSINVSSLFLNIGDNETVIARLNPETATVRDVVWTSKNTEVATIDSTGVVTAVSPGIALINVSSIDAKFNAYCVVTVAPVHTEYLAISAGGVSTTQLPGAMLQLSATLQPDNATVRDITWSSGDLSVATVDSTGLVKFVNVGETDITAVANDGFAIGSIHVVTTSDEEEVEDTVTTYRVTFGDFATGFRFKDDGEVYKTGYCSVPEGGTLRFKLNVADEKQANYSVMVNGSRISCGDDYWYSIENIHDNLVLSLRDGGAGSSVPQIDIGGDNEGMGFFQRLAAFFRKIVEFFRGMFNK